MTSRGKGRNARCPRAGLARDAGCTRSLGARVRWGSDPSHHGRVSTRLSDHVTEIDRRDHTRHSVILSVLDRTRTSHGLPACREAATPPEVSTPLPAIGEGVRQSALKVDGVQVGHLAPQLGAGPRGQLLQYLLKDVAGMPHIVQGTAAARAVRVLGIQGPSPRRVQECLISLQREGRSAGEDVVVVREALHSMYRQAGKGGEPGDPTRRWVLPDARTMLLGAQGARPPTRHRPFGMRSWPSSCQASRLRSQGIAGQSLRRVAYVLPTTGAGSGVPAVGMQDCLGDLPDTVHGDAGPLFDGEGMVGGLQFDERTLAERARVSVRLQVHGAG